MLILGIETSCDETSIALVEAKNDRLLVHKNLVASQIKIHQKYGGVVPEVAARHHVEIIAPLLAEALKGIKPKDIDAIATTAGPGLVTALLVGVETARTLAYIWKKPLIAVNHLAGHIYANWLPSLEHQNTITLKHDIFPALILIVSGGHTELVLMKKHFDFKIIGQTRDDAAGECFDKVAKILGLPYPGGPAISRLSEKWKSETLNPKSEISFPRPMIDSPDYDFSFSGLKTAVLYHVKEQRAKNKEQAMGDDEQRAKSKEQRTIDDVCTAFEQAAVDVLVHKTVMAAQEFDVKTVMLGGGVAANRHLQTALGAAIKKISNIQYLISDSQYYADNAAMIAAAG